MAGLDWTGIGPFLSFNVGPIAYHWWADSIDIDVPVSPGFRLGCTSFLLFLDKEAPQTKQTITKPIPEKRISSKFHLAFFSLCLSIISPSSSLFCFLYHWVLRSLSFSLSLFLSFFLSFSFSLFFLFSPLLFWAKIVLSLSWFRAIFIGFMPRCGNIALSHFPLEKFNNLPLKSIKNSLDLRSGWKSI